MPTRKITRSYAAAVTASVAAALASAAPAGAMSGPADFIDEAKVAEAIEKTMRERDVPGCCVGILVGEDLAYSRAFGLRDLASNEPATLDTLFQLGSVTKTFTAALMCKLRDEGILSLDDQIARHLPTHVKVPREPGGRPITLRHLATHTSGLPRSPLNRRNLPDSPSVALPYHIADLHAALSMTDLALPTGARVSYSNFGVDLLGHVLECAGGERYETLLRTHVLQPLGMADTMITIGEADERRLALHYWPNYPRQARPRWRFGEICGAGGLASTLPDMAKYVAMHLRAYSDTRGPVSGGSLRELLTPQGIADESWSTAIGLAWFIRHDEKTGDLISHGGEVDGHSSLVLMSREHNVAVIALANVGADTAEAIGRGVADVMLPPLSAQRQAAIERFNAKDWVGLFTVASQIIERNPHDALAHDRLATAFYNLKRFAEAARHYEQACREGFMREVTAYNAACSHALNGDVDAALRWLRKARDCGYGDREHVLSDPDLVKVREDPRFQELLTID